MTAEERARQIADSLCLPHEDHKYPCPMADWIKTEIEQAIDQARKEGFADGFARGQEKKASCICSKSGPCAMHVSMIEKARKESFEQARDMAAHIIEASVNIRGIENASEAIINCHLQSRHDAEICRALRPPREGAE